MTEPRGKRHPSGLTEDRHRALITTRILWAAAMGSSLMIAMVMTMLLVQGARVNINPGTVNNLMMFTYAMIVGGALAAYTARLQIYKANWKGNGVDAGGYIKGNVVYFVIIEGVVLLSLVNTFFAGTLGAPTGPAIIGIALLAANFPTDGPLRDTAFDSFNDLTK